MNTRLLGTWRLAGFSIEFSDGRPELLPFGPDATGLLMYGEDGTMSAILSRADRTLSAERLEKADRAPAHERAAAFDSYLSYAGRWWMEGDEVVHAVELSLAPNAVGIENRRRVSWVGDELHLSYTLTARSGVERLYRLRWRR